MRLNLQTRKRALHVQDLRLEALRSAELPGGLGRPSSGNDLSSPPSLASVGKTGSGINPELVDLTCMLSPGSSSVSPDSQREEVAIQLLLFAGMDNLALQGNTGDAAKTILHEVCTNDQ